MRMAVHTNIQIEFSKVKMHLDFRYNFCFFEVQLDLLAALFVVLVPDRSLLTSFIVDRCYC